MNNVETVGNITNIRPIASDKYDQQYIDKCIKIAKINSINKRLQNNCCSTSCPLKTNSVSKCVATGSVDAEIMLVEAMPTEYESFTGCFTDEKGYFLEDVLASLGLKRSDLYCTSIIKCPCVSPNAGEQTIKDCLNQYFFQEIDIIKPKKIIFTYFAFNAFSKYYNEPFGALNYFCGQKVTLWNGLETIVYVMYEPKDFTDQTREACKQGLQSILR